MPSSPLGKYLTHLRGILARREGAEDTDGQLLERYLSHSDECAFEMLLRRHGPMVLGVCRRILGDFHEAEDALQATFLILARKAASLRRPEVLACWLHGVAARLAHKARVAAQRRASYSHHLAAEPADSQPDPLDLLTVREMLSLIDEEIRALREVYRLPLVLCDLEGRTQEEAAGLLGWTVGSLRGRSLRGRERLRARLTRRGVTLPAGIALPFVPAALSESLCAGPVVPPQLIATVTQAAVRFSMDSVVTPLSGPTVDLAKEGLRALMLSKIRIAAAMILTITLFIAGAGLLGRQIWEAIPAEQHGEDKPQPVANAEPKPAEERRPVHLDRFGDPLPEGAVARLGTVRLRHGREVRSVAFHPDGKTLASGGQDNTVRLWDIANGKELRHFTAVTGQGSRLCWVSSIAFSSDGKFLAAGTMNGQGEVVIWELATGKESRPLRQSPPGVVSIAFSPKDKVLAAGTQDGLIHLWNTDTTKLLRQLKGHQNQVESIAFSEDGKTLASASRDKTVRLWDPAMGRKLLQLKGHTDMVLSVAFSGDGKTLASGSWDNTIRLWDAATGKELHILKGHAMAVSTLVFLPDGKTLASGSWDGRIRLWNTVDGKELRQMQGYLTTITSISISRDGKTLASGSWDRIVRLWDVAKGEERQPTQGNKSELWTVAISPNGQRVATGGEEGVVRLWDASSGRELLQLNESGMIAGAIGGGTLRMLPWNHLHFAADGKTVSVPGEFTLGRWDAETGKQINQTRYQVQTLYTTRDSKFVTGFDGQGNLCLMDTATGKNIRRFKTAQNYWTSAVSADGQFLACIPPEENGTVIIWDLARGKEYCRCKGTQHIASALAFSPDGKYLAGNTVNGRFRTPETPIYLWDAATGREIRHFQAAGHYVNSLAYSSDGRMLASGGEDKTIRLWEAATGKERQCFKGHQGNVNSVAFSPDGTRLVSASEDTTALVWDTIPSTLAGKATANQLQTAWNDLASDDAAKAHEAIWLLARNPKQSVPLLHERVPPARALNAEMRKQVERWLSDLDSDQAAVRERANAELEKRVMMAEPMLRKALTVQPSLEQRKRIERILEHLQREQVTFGRALEALEHAHSQQSRQLLKTISTGEPQAWLTREAKAALGRLDRVPP